MTEKANRSSALFRANHVQWGTEVFFHLVLALLSLICIIPFVFVIIISLSSEESIHLAGYSFVPMAWSLDAYRQVLRMGDLLWRSYFNSFLITVIGTGISVPCASCTHIRCTVKITDSAASSAF